MQGIKLLLKILLSVGFAAALITAVTTTFLVGMIASDTLIVVTEATPYPPEAAVFLASIEANIVRNIFWLSLSFMGFCLIALYYLYGNFQIFLPPAILAIISFILIQVALAVIPGYISVGLASSVGPIILKGFERAQQANYLVLAFGIALLTASLRLKPKY
ncbi:MAG: hypothetical protein Q7J85_02470 [Bacillota bacterium]|nr:hypothetical protein [Bacillota bacterium]